MEMMGAHNGGWLIDYMDEGTEFLWANHQIVTSATTIVDDGAISSAVLGLDFSQKEDVSPENSCNKKRPRTESCAEPGSKASREKIRRDKLNEKFIELCSILEPGKTPKTDKIIILNDATRLLNQLRSDAKKLQETNEELQDTIKSLKAEKMELREEKVKLKTEKERLEQAVKVMSVPPPLVPHPSYHAAAAAAYAANKTMPYHVNYPPPMAMWQWMAPASLDTSQDHVLRPPVA